MKDMFKMMKEAASMQRNLKKIQSQLKKKKVEYSAGDGKVVCEARGDGSVSGIKIDPSVLSGQARDLERMVMQAVNGALDEAKKQSAEEMSGLMGDMGMPNIPGLKM